MPLTGFQIDVLRLLASTRSKESYVAGATVLHASEISPRFSEDIDLFHDTHEAVHSSFSKDQQLLESSHFAVEVIVRGTGFIRALVTKGAQSVKMDWAQDSAFRFFPLVSDELLGVSLSLPDIATNKVLACANRDEPRDIVDLVYLNQNLLSLGFLIWAACGKDEGFTPGLICDQLRRHSRLHGPRWKEVMAVTPLDPVRIKTDFLASIDGAEQVCFSLPPQELGCFYLNSISKNIEARTESSIPHFGTVFGSLPQVADTSVYVSGQIRNTIDVTASQTYPPS